MRRFKFIIVVVSVAWIFAAPVEAGIIITNLVESSLQPGEKTTNMIYLEKDRIRMEMKGKNIDQVSIFRKDKEVFWVIDNKEGTFMEMTKEELQKQKMQMDETMKRMEEQLKRLPPEQRKMMEEMMKRQKSAITSRTPKITFKKVATGEKVNKWIADRYEGSVEGEKKMEIWTSDWKKLGVDPEDFKVMEEVGAFFDDLSKGSQSFFKIGSIDQEKDLGYIGIPVKTITYSAGRIDQKTELKEIKRENLASSLFEVTPGLKKKEMPSMASGQGPEAARKEQRLEEKKKEKESDTFFSDIRSGNVDAVKRALELGVDPNSKGPGGTALIYAIISCVSDCTTNHVRIVRLLLEKGADVNMRDMSAQTPLMRAGISPIRKDIWKALLEKGADMNAKTKKEGTPILMLQNNTIEFVKDLIQAGADVNITDMEGRTALFRFWGDREILQLLLKKGANINAKDKDGRTILHHNGIAGNDPEDFLEKLGADKTIKDNRGCTAEEYAYAKNYFLPGEVGPGRRPPLDACILEQFKRGVNAIP